MFYYIRHGGRSHFVIFISVIVVTFIMSVLNVALGHCCEFLSACYLYFFAVRKLEILPVC